MDKSLMLDKIQPMEDREDSGFSWTGLFFVTGISFFFFSIILNLLDASHVTLFNKIGLASISLGVLSFLNRWLGTKFSEGSSITSDN
jgi:hypothetical protein